MSAVTQNEYTGNGSTTTYSFTFPYLKESDIKVSLDSVVTTDFSLQNATTIQFNTAPASNVKIKIFRETSVDDLTATFYAGSAIKSEDLNDNFTQNLFVTQEVNQRAMSSLGATMTGELQIGSQGSLKFEGSTDDANETTLAVTDPTADRTITLPNETGEVVLDTLPSAKIFVGDSNNKVSEVTVTGDIAIDNTGATTIQENAVETSMIGENVVTTSEVDGSLTNANIASDAAILGTKISPDFGAQNISTTGTINNLTTTELAILDGATLSTDELNILDGVTATKDELNILDGVTATKDEINILDGVTATKDEINILDGVTATKDEINILDGVTATKDEINILDGVTATKDELNILDGVTATKDELNYVDGVTSAIQTQLDAKQGLDSELTTLAGMQSGTASKLAGGTALTADIADLNIVDGMTKATSLTTNSDDEFPTSKAVADHVKDVVDSVGGFKIVANKDSFPTSHPDPKSDAGMVMSLVDADGLTIDENGTSGNAQTSTGGTVTITGFPASVRGNGTNVNGSTNSNPHTLSGDLQLLVQTTTTEHTYAFYKFVPNDSDVLQLSDDINLFNARYRVGNSNPTNSLDAGDLFFNTSTSKLMVYNATNSAWEEAQSIGNFFISTFSEAFDGSRTQFTISNAPANVQQILLSLNGVIQKPGTAFTLSGSTVTLASAPASGTEYFAVVMGSTVNIGQPSNNTVNTDVLMSGAVTNAKVSSATSDRIAGSKITPDFGSQNLSTTGTAATGALTVTGAIASTGNIEITNNAPGITFTDSDDSHQFYIQSNGDALDIVDATNSTTKIGISNTGHITNTGNVSINGGYLEVANANVYIEENLNHSGDAGTRIRFPAADVISFETASEDRLAISNSELVVNDPGNNVDFRVEGDTETNLFFADASAEKIGIGTQSPNARLTVHAGSDNSDVAVFTGGDIARGLKITTSAASGPTNDGVVTLNAQTSSVGEIALATAGTERFRIGSSGQLGIGSTPAYGNSGEVLVSQGASAAPQWATVSNLTTGTMTNVADESSEVFGNIPANAKIVRVLFQNLYSTNGGRPMFRVGHAGSGGTILTSGYKGYSGYYYENRTSFSPNNEADSTMIPIAHSGWAHSSYRWNGYLDLVRVYADSSNQSQLWTSVIVLRENATSYWSSHQVHFYNRNSIYMGDNISLDRIEVNANGSSSGQTLVGNVQLQYFT